MKNKLLKCLIGTLVILTGPIWFAAVIGFYAVYFLAWWVYDGTYEIGNFVVESANKKAWEVFKS